jgi:hypothetical protein
MREALGGSLRVPAILLLVAATIAPLTGARAWGVEGHRIVALIAERHLTPAAAAAVKRLLAADGATRLADVASWADDWRETHRETGPWHHVDIPLEAAGYDPARDCPHDACVIAQIRRFARDLADTSRPNGEREQALKFLIHLVGDVHQPLHAADHHDNGGGDVRVIYDGRPSNLRRIWDVELVRAASGVAGGEAVLVDQLDSTPADTPDIEPVAWANEAHGLAANVAYPNLPDDRGEDLSGDYTIAVTPVVNEQLRRAGLRLAATLNAALDDRH